MDIKLKQIKEVLEDKHKRGTISHDDEWVLSKIRNIKRLEDRIRYENLSPNEILELIELIQFDCYVIGKSY